MCISVPLINCSLLGNSFQEKLVLYADVYLDPSPEVTMQLFLQKKSTAFSRRKQLSELLYKKVSLDNLENRQKNICDTVSFITNFKPEAWNFIKKETLA